MSQRTVSGRTHTERLSMVRGHLRGKFIERDRTNQYLDVLDGEIKQLIRTLSDAEGLIVPMRVEQARRYVNGGEITEEAAE